MPKRSGGNDLFSGCGYFFQREARYTPQFIADTFHHHAKLGAQPSGWRIAADLSGSINQALDQKYQFQKQIAQIKDNTRLYDIESYAVHCCLVIGKTPDGGQWRWGDLGTPSASITGRPTATAYRLGNQTRINVFVRSTDGQLQEVFWDGNRWQWSVRGSPSNITIDSEPDVIVWQLAGVRRLNVFAVGHNGHAYSNWWDGS